jgi:hypothetical protein
MRCSAKRLRSGAPLLRDRPSSECVYSLGSAGGMGPGYFPLLLGFVLGALGAILIARSVALDGEPLPRFHLRPLLVMAVAVCLLGLLIEPAGLVVSLAALKE